MTKKQMEELVKAVAVQVMAAMEETAPKKAAPKTAAKKTAVKTAEKAPKSQSSTGFTTKKSGDFTSLFKDGRKIGHFNHSKGLFWFYRNQIGAGDWKEIKKFLKKFAKKADFERNAARFKRAGILSSSDFSKVSFETFMAPAKQGGIFC